MKLIIKCLGVFLARMLEISISSVRTIVLVKGKSIIASILAFIEILIWLFVARDVLTSDSTNLALILSYAGGYACGTYVGGLINKYLLRGSLTCFVVTHIRHLDLIDKLKINGYGVTKISTEEEKLVLLIQFKKKNLKNLKETIKSIDKRAFVIVNESMHVENGYMP